MGSLCADLSLCHPRLLAAAGQQPGAAAAANGVSSASQLVAGHRRLVRVNRCRRGGPSVVVRASQGPAGSEGNAQPTQQHNHGRPALFASVSQSVGAPAGESSAPPSSSYPGTPLFWVGVGVALSVGVNWGFKKLYAQMQALAMRQFMEAMKSGGAPGMGGMGSPFGPGAGMGPGGMGSPFGQGMPFPPPGGMPFPPPPPPPSGSAPGSSPKKSSVVDVAATVSETSSTTARPPPKSTASSPTKPAAAAAAATAAAATAAPSEPAVPSASPSRVIEPDADSASSSTSQKKSSFFQDAEVVDSTQTSTGGYSWSNPSSSSSSTSSNAWNAGSAFGSGASAFGGGGGGGGGKGKMTVEALERMMEDPTIQKMIFPYLPEEMRDPATFKWMMQNPAYRSQLEQMLETTGGAGFDDRVIDMMKNFDLNSPEVKQQFSQMGVTPEQVVSKIMSDPKLAAAFQNPRLQAAILDVSTNPYNLPKYSNDPEVMELFQLIQEVFPIPQQ